MPVGLLGKKLGQTRVYDGKGVLIPVTVVLAGPNRVLQCKTQQTDGYNAVQLGFSDQKEHRVAKPLLGHIKKFLFKSFFTSTFGETDGKNNNIFHQAKSYY